MAAVSIPGADKVSGTNYRKNGDMAAVSVPDTLSAFVIDDGETSRHAPGPQQGLMSRTIARTVIRISGGPFAEGLVIL